MCEQAASRSALERYRVRFESPFVLCAQGFGQRQRKLFKWKSRASGDDDVREIEQIFPAVPGCQGGESVCAHQQAKRLHAGFATRLGQCVDGKTRTTAAELTCIHHEPGIALDRQPDHCEAMLGRGGGLAPVRRHSGGNHPYLLKIEGFGNLFGETQVREMDRIERAPEQADGGRGAQLWRRDRAAQALRLATIDSYELAERWRGRITEMRTASTAAPCECR